MLYKVTVKKTQQFSNGIRLEKGMSIEVVSVIATPSSFLASSRERENIRTAFMTKYGVDLQKVYALNPTWLEAQRIN